MPLGLMSEWLVCGVGWVLLGLPFRAKRRSGSSPLRWSRLPVERALEILGDDVPEQLQTAALSCPDEVVHTRGGRLVALACRLAATRCRVQLTDGQAWQQEGAKWPPTSASKNRGIAERRRSSRLSTACLGQFGHLWGQC